MSFVGARSQAGVGAVPASARGGGSHCGEPALGGAAAGASGLPDVGGLGALLALRHFEADALVLGEALEAAFALDVVEVGEEVLATTIRRDKAEALAGIEPLHGSCLSRHIDSFRLARNTCCAMQKRQEG